LIASVLVNYATWALGDFSWLLPMLLAQVMLALIVRNFLPRAVGQIPAHQVKGFLYNVIIPLILIFASNVLRDREAFYIPYVASIVAQVAVIFYFFLATKGAGNDKYVRQSEKQKVSMGCLCGITATLIIGVAPTILSASPAKLIGLLAMVVGAWLSIGIFEFLDRRYDLLDQKMLRQKMRLLSVAIGTLIVFGTMRIAGR
jgi:hypothetical protein